MWIYQGKEVTEEDTLNKFGFVYIITRLANGDLPERYYIGKKQLISNRKKKLTKKELAAAPVKPGRKPTHKRVISESDWINYWGSDDELKKEVKELGEDAFIRTILRFCTSKKQLSYYEEKEQFIQEVLEKSELFYNKNIGGTYFIKDLI